MGAAGDSNAVLFLNDNDILTGVRLDDYIRHIRTLLDQGVAIGGIGVQGHLHSDTFDPAALRNALVRPLDPHLDLDRLFYAEAFRLVRKDGTVRLEPPPAPPSQTPPRLSEPQRELKRLQCLERLRQIKETLP